MSYPTDSDFPGAIDTIEDRTDNVDIVWASDFDFQDKQIRRLQSYLGESGKMIGENIAGHGLDGAVSAVADGGIAFRLAARNTFTSGSLLSIEDDFDGTPQQKMRLNFAGRLWTAAGADFSDSDFLHLPISATLPSGMVAGDAGRLLFKTGLGVGTYVWNGTSWVPQGIVWEGYMDAASDYQYTQAASPIEEVIGQFVFNGIVVAVGMKAVIRAIMTPLLSAAGTSSLKLYEMGPAAGPPTSPRLVSSLITSSSGLEYLSQDLTVVSSGPLSNEILDTARMYELTLIQSSQSGDTIYLGSAGINVEIE